MAKLINKTEVVQKEELLVFGYSCKLFRDDEKATFIENGSHLIPWMGNSSLMIDRYDVRGALYDLDSAASVGANDTSYLSDVERKEEELSEQERYLALYHDLEATAEQEEEEKKRLLVELETGSSGFKQVGFSYDAPGSAASEHTQSLYAQQQLQCDQPAAVHPQGYTPHPDDDLFIPPPTLLLPTGLPVPTSIKQHKIIVKTAKFIAKQGSQMEIVLKTKQANNSMFGFLSFDNYLNHYYKHIISLIKANKFREEEVSNNNGNSDGDAHEVSFNPSADAAPGVKTPKAAVKTAPPADCSYLKLISKIRENQAKSGVNLAAATDSRPQSPLVETPAAPIISSTTGTDVTASAAINTSAAATLPQEEVPATVTLPVSSTPVPALPLQPLPSSKPFAGLVDYPSFNRTNEDDNDGYSLSESDSDEDRSRSPLVGASNGAVVNGGKQAAVSSRLDGAAKKAVPSVAAAKAKHKEPPTSPTSNKVTSFDDIRWPSPAEQIIIDKIACYIVKNGSKFEKAMKSRGDSRFQFLDPSHDHFPYYQLKQDLYSEVFGELISHNVSKPTERANDLKSVVASVCQMSSSISNNKSWSTTNSAGKKGSSGSSCNSGGGAAHTICFSIKQRRDQEVTLPATSFPLESSSSEEDTEDMEEEERERRAQEREQRRKWRKMKREQFEREKREKKEKDDRAKRQEEEKRLKQEKESQKMKELEEQENASGDEDLYDIFKYAQESGKDEGGGDAPSSRQASPAPDAGASPALKPSRTRRKASSDPKLRRKKAAHAFLSKLKGAPEDEPMIGPQLPPGMETMDISPKASPPPSPTPSSPSHTPPLPASCTPPPRSSCTPPPPPPPAPSSAPVMAGAGSAGPPPPPAAAAADTDSLNSLLSGLPGTSKKARHSRHGLLAAAVTSLLTNEEIGGSADLHKTKILDVKNRDDSKSRRHKQKRRRDVVSSPDRSSSRQRSLAASSSKKRKRKRSHSRHHHHHKKRHHRSPHGRSSSSHRKGASSSHVAKKKKSSKSSSSSRKDKPKKKKSKRRRSASVSSVSSVSSSSSSSSRSSSTESSYRSRASKRSVRDSSGESGSDPEVQIIDSDDDHKSSVSSSRASSVVSVTSSAARREPSLPLATPASSRASSTSRDAGAITGSEARILSSGAASPALPPLPPLMSASSSPLLVKPLPSNFDMKTSTAMAKITEGLRAKVHALMDKKRPDD